MTTSTSLQPGWRGSLDMSTVHVELPTDVFRASLHRDESRALEVVHPWCRELIETSVERGPGFLVIDGKSYPEISSDERRVLTERIAKSIGLPFTHRSAHLNQGLLCDVKDKGYRFTSYRDQNFHNSNQEAVEHTESTELPEPIRKFMLSVIHPACRGGATRLVSIPELLCRLESRHGPSFLSELTRPFVFDTGRGERTTAPILSISDDGQVHFRWMLAFLMNGKSETAHWSDQVELVLDCVASMINEMRIVIMLKRGDIGIFNNRAVLHGRDEFEGCPGHPSRWLIRAWFK